jgi:hypothetical protein
VDRVRDGAERGGVDLGAGQRAVLDLGSGNGAVLEFRRRDPQPGERVDPRHRAERQPRQLALADGSGPHRRRSGGTPFENGAHNFGITGPFTLQPVGFYKDHEGIVHLQGIAETGSTAPDFVFTLPPGFRPASGKTLIFEQVTEASAFIFGSNITVESFNLDGKILGTEEKNPVVLDGISFRAES